MQQSWNICLFYAGNIPFLNVFQSGLESPPLWTKCVRYQIFSMVFLQGLRQPPGVSNDLIIQKPAYLSTLSPKKIWICFLLSLLCLNSLHTSADYIFVNLSFYLPNRCMRWWEILKHTLGAMMVISLAKADGLPPISPWNQWNARKWLAGELFHIVRSFGKRL